MVRERAEELLKTMLGEDKTFRDGQWEAIETVVVRKERALIVQRTGWGKSIVYFIATKLLREEGKGITLLISPLLSLMRNQIEMASKIGIRAATINSSNPDEWDEIEAELQKNSCDILLITPEKLVSRGFNELLAGIPGNIGMVVVDEAHCISDWGHDFRPDYRRIVGIIEKLPAGVPVLATTATANDRVVNDIKEQLGEDLKIMRGPLTRQSLRIQTVVLKDQAERLAWLAENISRLPGTGIIYCLTIVDCRRVATWLQSVGINAFDYHGKINNEDRINREQQLLHNEVKALVATTALGMGFDKPDLGFVVHYQRPGSLVAYYQQIGRAGRNLDNAYAILLNGGEDDEIQDYFIKHAFPDGNEMRTVLSIIADANDGISIASILRDVNLSENRIKNCIELMEIEGAIFKSGGKYYRSTNPWEPDEDRMNRVTKLRYQELQQMQDFVLTDKCYMQVVAEELDDAYAEPCGKCANCQDPFFQESVNTELVNKAILFLRRGYLSIKIRKKWPALGVGRFRGNIAAGYQNQEGRALCRYGDAGWGTLVKSGKYKDGRFSDELVEAAVELINDHWQPEPMPEWVTAIPSRRHPELVPGLAKRVAALLDIPYHQVLTKTKDTVEQKMMENSNQQANNALEAFSVIEDCPRGPVLLIDDMVDSRWTLTVCGALLQETGSGPVFPLALAATWSGGDSE
ncbi:MAG: RecQ family ATP-dependent DNA helicase [Syntrophomonadaceae bacterium]|nr:RecQ family ATP-dependent DNA helicase [Syntrophomonadaceae bacterium]MDD4549955.1 RecQ family ATP-dependent DNA helicase [Syntrophomonadaceae bacterium]